MPELVHTITLEASTSITPVTDTPPEDSHSSSVLTLGIVIIAAGCGAGFLVLVTMMVLILVLCRRRLKKCKFKLLYTLHYSHLEWNYSTALVQAEMGAHA